MSEEDRPLLDIRQAPDAEQRQFPRAFITVAVTMEIGDQIVRGTECRNVSMGGMFVQTSQPITMGTSGTVTLTKRCGDKRYSFSAGFKVVRVEEVPPRGPGVGVAFKEATAGDQENLRNIVDFHLSIMIKEKLLIDEEKLGGLIFTIAQTRDELEQAFKIVHDSYVRQEYMDPHPSGMRLTLFNALPQSVTLVGKDGPSVVMAVSIFPDSLLGLPMDSLYKKELAALRDAGRYIAEAGALATHLDYREPNPNAPLHLQKAVWLYLQQYLDVDDYVIAVHPKHRLYYQHVQLCRQIGETRPYDYVKGAAAVAMRGDMRELPARLKEMYDGQKPEKDLHHFYFVRQSACIRLPPEKRPFPVWNRELIQYFFEEKTDVFRTGDRKTVSMIQALYA